MDRVDLSVIIPARNEEWLQRTCEDLLHHMEGNTEVIVILDGYLPDPPLTINDDRITILHNPEPVGQRAASNQGARIAKGKYLMKVDAHCAFDQGFDVKMMAKMKPDYTMVPVMRNLHVFDWVCEEGHRRYMGLSGPCNTCDKPTHKEVVWNPKPNPQSKSYRFDKTMHFQYWGGWYNQVVRDGDIVDLEEGLNTTMSIQGSCFMITKEKWFELDICSEDFHSWGQQGVEVACKTWLSGGTVVCNRDTWYAHMFRTKGGDFGFPYANPQDRVRENREYSKKLFQRDNWPLAKRKFQWILDTFKPDDWVETKGMIYYSDDRLDKKVSDLCLNQLKNIKKIKRMGATSSCLRVRHDWVDKSIRFPSLKPGYLSMFKQILAALENTRDDIIFFCEHDVLYHHSHFDFEPKEKDTFYYNQNVWFLRSTDGHSMHYDVNQLSGMCGWRDALLTHFRERYKLAEEKSKELDETDFNRWVRNMGFEPFTHGRVSWRHQFKYSTWMSDLPNIDIKHGKNATGQRWRKDQYRNQSLLINWTESDEVPGWGKGVDLIKRLIE